MEPFKDRLRMSRAAVGMTQEETAQKAGISYSTYRRYERGGSEPPLSDAARIADVLGVSLDYLAGRTDTPSLCK